MPTKFFIHKTFWNKNFLKNSRIPLRKFSAVWDIKISTENRDMPPLIHNFFFDTRKFPENRRVPLQSLSFRCCETKSSDKTVMPPPLLCMKIFDKRIFLKQHQSVFQWNVSVQWDKNFDGKSWYSPSPPPLIQTFSVPEINETLKDSPLPNFSALWDKKISTENRKSWHNSLKHKYFRYLKLMKH